MAAKFVVLTALLAVADCSVVPVARVDADHSSFSYDVANPNTGNKKSQVETRVEGAVNGQYSLFNSDGSKRTIDYTADDVNGFKAGVRKDGAVVSAPVVAAAPAVVAAASEVVVARINDTRATFAAHGAGAFRAAQSIFNFYEPQSAEDDSPSNYSSPLTYATKW